MPLFWVVSVFMVVLLLLMMVIFFFNISDGNFINKDLVNKSMFVVNYKW